MGKWPSHGKSPKCSWRFQTLGKSSISMGHGLTWLNHGELWNYQRVHTEGISMDSARVDHFLKVCLANWDVRVLNHTGEAHDCNLSLGIPWGKHTKGCGNPRGTVLKMAYKWWLSRIYVSLEDSNHPKYGCSKLKMSHGFRNSDEWNYRWAIFESCCQVRKWR